MGSIRSEQLEFTVTRLLCVLDSVAEIIKLRLHGEPALLVVDGPAKVSDEQVHFIGVQRDRLDFLTGRHRHQCVLDLIPELEDIREQIEGFEQRFTDRFEP